MENKILLIKIKITMYIIIVLKIKHIKLLKTITGSNCSTGMLNFNSQSIL